MLRNGKRFILELGFEINPRCSFSITNQIKEGLKKNVELSLWVCPPKKWKKVIFWNSINFLKKCFININKKLYMKNFQCLKVILRTFWAKKLEVENDPYFVGNKVETSTFFLNCSPICLSLFNVESKSF